MGEDIKTMLLVSVSKKGTLKISELTDAGKAMVNKDDFEGIEGTWTDWQDIKAEDIQSAVGKACLS